MKRLLSVILIITMLLVPTVQMTAFALPSVVTVGDSAGEQRTAIEETNYETEKNWGYEIGDTCHDMITKWFSDNEIDLMAEVSNQNLFETINEYFDIRLKSLIQNEAVQNEILSEDVAKTETIRREGLKNHWSYLNVSVVDADHNIRVDRIQQDEESYVVYVYEWVFYDYYDLDFGSNMTDVSGFGVEHILYMDMTGDDYLISDDKYDELELSGVCTVELDKILIEENADETVDDFDLETATLYSTNFYADYDVDAVIAYSDKYALNYNTAYYNFNPNGGDCANFVSQCISAGGMPQVVCNTYGTSGWFYKAANNRSATWTGAPQLKTWMANNRGVLIANPTSAQMYAGSPFFSNDSGHAMICVGNNTAGSPIFSAHNNDRWREKIDLSSVNYTVQLTATNPLLDAYDVIYDANGGNGAPAKQTASKGSTITLSTTAPTKNGYSFIGWSTSSSATDATYLSGASYIVTEDVTLYAVWVKVYDGNWSDWSEWDETVVTGSVYRKVETKVQYVYYHYILQFSDGKCGAYPINSATFNTYLPQYPTTYKDEHTYESDTQLSKVDELHYGSKTYDCYDNLHCPNEYDYDNGANACYLYYRGTKTVYRYSDALYTITYNANDGTGAPSEQTKVHGSDVTLSRTIPTRDGYTFKGWATSASGDVEYTAGATYTENSDITLYAVWKSNAVSVTGVSLDKSSVSLKIGETDTLTATVAPSSATNKNVSWKSSDNSVATVENGIVTAIGEGTATITVTTDDGSKTATCTVTVAKPEEPDPEAKATVTLSNVTGRAGDTVSVVVSLDTDEQINTLGFSGISYDENVLTFDGFTSYDEVDDISTLKSYDESRKKIVIGLDELQTFNGRLFAINFVINENAEDGVCGVDLSSSIKFDHTELVVNTVSGSVTVVSEILGDLNRDEYVDLNDAILLLQYSMFPGDYPLEYRGSVDFTKDGYVDLNDAILLLQYSMFPDDYPIR